MAVRKDVTSADKKEAEKKYGDVTYADETNKKYPIDSEEHVRAAWSYINMPKNASKYSSSEVSAIKSKIISAAKKFGIEIETKSDEKKEIHNSEKKVIEKEVLRVGKWKHPDAPNGVLEVTKEYLAKLSENFKRGRLPAPVYRGHRTNEEAEENPNLVLAKNIQDLEVKDNSLFAKMEVDPKDIETYNDVSASIIPNYEDHETHEVIGPVLNHVAWVMNPFIKGLKPATQLAELNRYSILLSEIIMDTETPKTEVKEVETPVVETPKEETPEEKKPEVETPTKVEEVVEEKTNLSDTPDDIRIKLSEAQETIKKLEAKSRQQEAEAEYKDLLSKGKVLPTMKEEFIALSLAGSAVINLADDKKTSVKEQLSSFISKLPVLVNLSEKGINVELGDSIPTDLIASMKESWKMRNPKGTDAEFNKYIEDNKGTIEEYSKKNKK